MTEVLSVGWIKIHASHCPWPFGFSSGIGSAGPLLRSGRNQLNVVQQSYILVIFLIAITKYLTKATLKGTVDFGLTA